MKNQYLAQRTRAANEAAPIQRERRLKSTAEMIVQGKGGGTGKREMDG